MATGKVGALLVEMRADLGKLRLDVKEMENVFKSSFTNIQASATNFAKSLAGSLGIGLGIGSIVAFGKSVLDLGGKLSDLSAATGISVKALSGIKSTLEENGTSVDAFAKGVFKLQAELGNAAKETDPVRVAIGRLGLDYKNLTQSSPEEFIKKVTDALAKQENPLTRNALAQGVFKKAAAELIPAVLELAGKFDQLKKQGLDEADAKKLDQFGDALTRMGNVMRIVAAGPLADFIRAFERFFNLTEEGRLKNSLVSISEEIDRIESMLERRKSLTEKGLGFFAGGTEDDNKKQVERLAQLKEQLADAGGQLGKLRGAGAKPTAPFIAPPDTTAMEKAKQILADLKTTYTELKVEQDALTQGAGAKQAAEHFKLLADTANKLEVSVDKLPPAFRKYIEEINATKDAINDYKIAQEALKNIQENADDKTKELTKSTEDFEKVAEELASTALTPTGQQIAAIVKRYNEWITVIAQEKALHPDKDITAIKNEAEALKDKLVSLVDTTGQWGKLTRDAAVSAIPSTEEYRKQVAQLTAQFIDLGITIQRVGKEENIDPEKINAAMANINKAMIIQIGDIQTSGDKLGEEIANSITTGMANTLTGIETGQQTIGAGMKNLLRNMMLELQGAIFDKTILEPLKAIASGFISGLVGALDDAANKELKKWAKGLGQQVSSWLGTGLSSILGAFGGGGTSLAGATFTEAPGAFAQVPFRERGGMIPSFAGGGLFIGHGGEFVMQKKAVDNIGADTLGQMNKTGKVPGGGSVVNVEINGDITPRQPNMTPDQVVKVTAGNIVNDGMVMSAIEQRLRLRGK